MVTGANGHLGNNVVRSLLDKGHRVRATVRNTKNTAPFTGLDCEVVYADLLDKDSLSQALAGVNTLYQVAAVFKQWAVKPEREIVHPAVMGTKNILTAAKEQGVKKVVYVSSVAALDHYLPNPLDENSWNHDYWDPYYEAKTESEKLAWDVSRQLDIDLVTVLPSAIIGPHCYGHLTPTMDLFHQILHNHLPFDPRFNFNFVDARDVAQGMLLAAQKGKTGERYILATEKVFSTTELFEIARSIYPNIRRPMPAPTLLLQISAALMQLLSRITLRPPMMLPSQVRHFHTMAENYTILKAKKELGFQPRPVVDSLRDTFAFLARSR